MSKTGASQQSDKGTERTSAETPEAATGLNVVDSVEKVPPVDKELFNRFIRTVFHAGLVAGDDGEHLLFWRATGKPGLPMSATEAARRLASSRGASGAWYYGTSVTRLDADGKLRNKKALFSSLHVVVLDDVGTKVDPKKLPEAFRKPSYIIESSPGNYQYGLVLEEPLEDYNQASALIQLVYTSGYTDSGGRMPTKLVRLPFGVNGKPGEKHDFPVNLHQLTDKQYTPEEILEAIDSELSWADVVSDPGRVDKNLNTSSVGAVAWQPLVEPLTTDGATDAVLDWFEQNNMVHSYGNDWITVRCPWGHLHTNGDDSAGYSPLGYGQGRWRNFRTFKCFHEHCAERKTGDLIHMLHETGQIDTLYPSYDPSWQLRKRLVLEAENHGVLDLDHPNPGASLVKMATADLVYCQTAPPLDPKKPPIKLFDMYKRSPEKLVVHGVRYAPGADWPFYESEGRLYLNDFHRPAFGSGSYNADNVAKFFDHMEYLCNGDAAAYQYLRNWFTCKVHDPQFRGNAILMTTPAFGTGRDTMTAMMAGVLGQNNVAGVTPDQLADKYNDFLNSQLVVCSETQDGNLSGPTGYYHFYERLKDMIDPGPRVHTINPKYGKQYKAMVYASFMLLSNHDDALRVVGHDRRIYVIANPETPRDPAYYTSLRAAMRDPDFYRDVYRYIMAECEPDFELANKPAPSSDAKQAMARASRTAGEVGVEAMVRVLGTDMVAAPLLSELLENEPRLADAVLQGKSPGQHTAYFRKLVRQLTHSDIPEEYSRLRVNGRRVRARACKGVTVVDWPEAQVKAQAAFETALRDSEAFANAVLETMEDIWEGQ